MTFLRRILFPCLVATAGMALAVDLQPGVGSGPGTRYATDAYPGFDHEENIVKPEKKTPRWFACLFGPKMTNAVEQFAWAQSCENDGSWGKARRAYDALVREWPKSPEAAKAQLRVAEIYLTKDLDYEEAFAEYRYLIDFYSLECDFDEVIKKLVQVAALMRQEGKTIIFFRFKNTVDVRRAYEALVMRSPGADFAPEALLTIAELREEEGRPFEAVKVYENLRNIHPDTPQARTAVYREAKLRMKMLDDYGYNRQRVNDTLAFFKQSLRKADLEDSVRTEMNEWQAQTKLRLAEDAYNSARFYDSPTRTLRSAINAYERFLDDFPSSEWSDKVRERLAELREKEEKK